MCIQCEYNQNIDKTFTVWNIKTSLDVINDSLEYLIENTKIEKSLWLAYKIHEVEKFFFCFY